MLLFIFIAALVLFGLSYVLPVGIPKGSVHGSAYFSKKKIIAKSKNGLVIDGVRRLSLRDSFKHLILVAPTGFGKTTRYLLNNILTIDNGSQIITDPKGELITLSRFGLEKRGYTIRVLDFRNPHTSIQFNPLLLLDTTTKIKEFCNALYAISNNNKHSESAIWSVGACRILEVLIRALLAFPNQKVHTIGSLIHLLNRMGSEAVTSFVKKYADKETIELYEYIIGQEAKIYYGQLSTAQASIAAFDSDEIKQIMQRTTFQFEELRKQKTALFLVLPVGVSDRYNFVLSLFYSQLFRYLLNTPLEQGDLPVFSLLEEFGNLKRIPDFQRIIGLIRSQKVSISIIGYAYINGGIVSHENDPTPGLLKPNNVFETSHLSFQI